MMNYGCSFVSSINTIRNESKKHYHGSPRLIDGHWLQRTEQTRSHTNKQQSNEQINRNLLLSRRRQLQRGQHRGWQHQDCG